MKSASAFTVATGKALEKRVEESALLVEAFPKRYHASLKKMLPSYLRYGPPTWKLVYELAVNAEARLHEAIMEDLKAIILAKQKECGHEKTDYQGDPSGNHDSTTTCCLCGKIL